MILSKIENVKPEQKLISIPDVDDKQVSPAIGNTYVSSSFQTPVDVCVYMSAFLPDNAGLILEPTAGIGNLVKALKQKGEVIAPDDFFKMPKQKFDWVVMNPPFTPMSKGYKILYDCMEMSDNIIALMPWLTIINGEKRTNDIMSFGLISITHLPRKIFNGARVQTCILQMSKGYTENTRFVNYCC